MSARSSQAHRRELGVRLGAAMQNFPEPPPLVYVVDLDAFDANADDLLRRAAGTPIRVASKSLRVPALLSRVLAKEGFAGILAYSLREALWLIEQEITSDVVLGYPTADVTGLSRLLAEPGVTERITLMVDDSAQLDLVDRARPRGASSEPTVRVALDVDASLRVGRSRIGAKRSRLLEVEDVLALGRQVVARPGFRLVGVLTYEAQVAGVADQSPGRRARSLVVRQVKRLSVQQLDERRNEIAVALADVTQLEFWNSGGTGSIETSRVAPTTEVTAGSGLLMPTSFDHFRSFEGQPAAFFGLPVVRRPSARSVVVSGGGLIASGQQGPDRAPSPWAPPGLRLTAMEGAGEVQTPLVGRGAASTHIGDWVWFRHAKAGELAEHTQSAYLLRGGQIIEAVPTYRGNGFAW